MFENLGNMGQIMSQIQKIQQEIDRLTVEAASADGAVKVVMNGKQDVIAVNLDPVAVNNLTVSQLENRLTEVLNQAKNKSRAAVKEKLAQATGLNLDGMMNMFG
ncbi:DNA-binding YbaB/EbfC family protein [Desulfohalotomaculum tongense]|uniref:YbaB/EbfC family nucleoid-associated protein n=1 Tax=Desulforadius tongensis TaxID=1216062 RepID=UPI00195F0F20|nr:YbaB/EbfC family nucleoid-associated protein [Desulforadius tongensis]MBM7855191.1 DNA-binding YbaB/EbfC family protein [Desulforadius tongensis]